MSTNYLIKILTLGDTSVGKTSIILRYTENTFIKKIGSTIGVDFKNKIVQINENENAKISLWDTAGQERFRNLTKNYYNGTDCALIVFDITSKHTFEIIPYWITELEKKKRLDEINLFIVGNKKDLSDKREVNIDDIINLQNKYKCKYFEVSALTGEGVEGLFEMAIEDCINMIKLKNGEQNPQIEKVEIKKKFRNIKDHKDGICC